MVFDIITGIILITTMVFGFRKGFIFTIIHALGWFGAMALALIAASPVRNVVEKYTVLDEHIHTIFLDKLSISTDTVNASVESLPTLVKNGIDTAAVEAAQTLADKLTFLTMTILCFLALLLVIKVIFFFITLALSKRDKGFTNVADGFLGMIAGLIRGIIFVFVFLALLVPFVNVVSPASTQLISDSLNASYFAGTLYDNNFIIVIIEDYLS